MKRPIALLIVLLISNIASAQLGLGTNTPDPSAVLHLASDSKGFLVPRMTEAQRLAIQNPASGLLIYQTDNGVDGAGLYIHNIATGWGKAGPGVVGPQGPAGPQGIQGPVGPTGATGPAGPSGLTGPQGAPGPTGPQGAAGPQGPQGNPGPQGSVGATGPQGPAGDDGAMGATGPAGPQGPQGVQGDPGSSGPAGPQGLAGPQGASGSDGADGPMGPQGPAGAQGIQGDPGPMGLQGPVGPAGPTGATGPQGPAGPQGLQGPTGNDGAVGATGPAGPVGLQGDPGATGPQGPTGAPGPTGPQGPPGPTPDASALAGNGLTANNSKLDLGGTLTAPVLITAPSAASGLTIDASGSAGLKLIGLPSVTTSSSVLVRVPTVGTIQNGEIVTVINNSSSAINAARIANGLTDAQIADDIAIASTNKPSTVSNSTVGATALTATGTNGANALKVDGPLMVDNLATGIPDMLLATTTTGNVIETESPTLASLTVTGTSGNSGLTLTNLTSSTPTSTGQPIGVDATGKIVTVASAANTGDLEVIGFTKLGSTAPAIKTLKLTGTTSGVQGGSVAVVHGIVPGKILSVSMLVEYSPNEFVPVGYLHSPGFELNYYIANTVIFLLNKGGSSFNILSKPFKMLITYEQ